MTWNICKYFTQLIQLYLYFYWHKIQQYSLHDLNLSWLASQILSLHRIILFFLVNYLSIKLVRHIGTKKSILLRFSSKKFNSEEIIPILLPSKFVKIEKCQAKILSRKKRYPSKQTNYYPVIFGIERNLVNWKNLIGFFFTIFVKKFLDSMKHQLNFYFEISFYSKTVAYVEVVH